MKLTKKQVTLQTHGMVKLRRAVRLTIHLPILTGRDKKSIRRADAIRRRWVVAQRIADLEELVTLDRLLHEYRRAGEWLRREQRIPSVLDKLECDDAGIRWRQGIDVIKERERLWKIEQRRKMAII